MISTRQGLIEEVMVRIEDLISLRRRAVCAHPLPRDVSLPQLYVLMAMYEEGPTTVSELAQRMRISTPSASSLIDRMEQHGLACRERTAEDRRVVHVAISTEGRRVVDELTGMRRDGVQRLLRHLSDDEMADVTRALQAIQRAAERELEDHARTV